MTKIKMHRILIATLAMMALACSDDLLDTKPRGKIGEDEVWNSEANTKAFIYNTYSEVLGMYSGYIDQEALTANNVSFQNGPPTVARNTTYTNEYNAGFNKYGVIRNCNLIIENVAKSTLGDAVKTELIAHGKFLRAMTYYWLAKRFGRVVWIDRVLTENEPTYELPQTPDIATTYQHIMADIDGAIAGLPVEPISGLADKWAAHALKSEVALTAAAYTGDETYYQEAIDAADAVVSSNKHPLASAETYEGLFNEKNNTDKEIILALYRNKSNTICLDTDMQVLVPNQKNDNLTAAGAGPLFKSPFIIFEAWLDWAPSQNLVDDYLVNDGGVAKKWDQTSTYLSNITPTANGGDHTSGASINSILFGNRDKRFDATIVHDESSWFGEFVSTKAKGNLNRRSTTNGGFTRHLSISNYYWRKNVYNVTPRVYWDTQTNYHWVIFRTGRVILNKAEALLRQDKIAEAVVELNKTRVGHGGLPASTASSSADAWADYKRERHVELAFENDYYFSLLRWGMYGGDANGGKAPQSEIDELKAIPTAIEINQAGTGYSIVPITEGSNNQRGFTAPRNYLFPVPLSELRLNTKLTQNPHW